MVIDRPHYLQKLIDKKENGFIKVVTGIRRCGKSYLLFNLYREYLTGVGVQASGIIELALD
jgi:predicted AAA+ superfamily ATPase